LLHYFLAGCLRLGLWVVILALFFFLVVPIGVYAYPACASINITGTIPSDPLYNNSWILVETYVVSAGGNVKNCRLDIWWDNDPDFSSPWRHVSDVHPDASGYISDFAFCWYTGIVYVKFNDTKSSVYDNITLTILDRPAPSPPVTPSVNVTWSRCVVNLSFFANTTYSGQIQGVCVHVLNASNLSQPVVGVSGSLKVCTFDGLPVTSLSVGPTDLDGNAVARFEIPVRNMNVSDRYLVVLASFSSVDYTGVYGWLGMSAGSFFNSRYLEFTNVPFPVSSTSLVAGFDIGLSTVNATNYYTDAIVSDSYAYIVRTSDSWTYPTPFEIHHLYLPGNNSYNISLSVPADLPSGEYIISGITQVIVHNNYVEDEVFSSDPFNVTGYDSDGLLVWHVNSSSLRYSNVSPCGTQHLSVYGYSPLVESLGSGRYVEFEVSLYSVSDGEPCKRLMTVIDYDDCRFFINSTVNHSSLKRVGFSFDVAPVVEYLGEIGFNFSKSVMLHVKAREKSLNVGELASHDPGGVISDFWSDSFLISSSPVCPSENPIKYVGATSYDSWETVSVIAVILDDSDLPITGLSPVARIYLPDGGSMNVDLSEEVDGVYAWRGKFSAYPYGGTFPFVVYATYAGGFYSRMSSFTIEPSVAGVSYVGYGAAGAAGAAGAGFSGAVLWIVVGLGLFLLFVFVVAVARR